MLAVGLWQSPVGELERGPGLQALYALRGTSPPPDDVVIVGMDSASAQALGLAERPDAWPRRLHAQLVAGLAASGARVIGFDLLFAQPRDPQADAALAAAIRHAGNVVLAETVRRDFVRTADGQIVASTEERTPPLPMFADAAAATAPFVLAKTPDGIIEFWPRVPTLGDRPSLPAVMAGRMFGGEANDGRDGRRIPDASPLTLNLYGPLGTVRTIPYPRALELLSDPGEGARVFAGKAVLVGYSESNQSRQIDAYRTPFSTAEGVDVSGVELCATALANLLDASWLRRPAEPATAALLALHAGLLTLPWAFVRPRAALLANAATNVAYAATAYVAFATMFLWLPVVVPFVFSTAIAGALGMALQHRDDLRRRAELERAIELGVPRRAVEKLATVLGTTPGRTVFAVCLCSDIVSYTTLSESLDPAAARDVLNRYFGRFIPVVEAHGGYASDLVGDSVMSLWIAESQPERAVADACRAAIELDRIMNGAAAGDSTLPTRLGLHCGPVFIGEVGGGERRELRAVGDIVNTASRIQGANKYLKTGVLASREVAERLDAAPSSGNARPARRKLGRFRIEGKGQTLELVQLSAAPLPAAAADAFDDGLRAFEAGDFDAARGHFAAAHAAGDAGPAVFYVEQCCRLAAQPRAQDGSGAVVLPGK